MSAGKSRTTAPDGIVRTLRDFCEMGLEGGDSDPLIEVMHSVAAKAAAEIERLRSVIVGCEIALNRDDDVSAVRRLLVKERHANGY